MIAARSGANISPTELEAELKFSPYVADALVVAGADGALGALIVIDHENVERWAQNKRIAFAGFTGLVRSDAVRDLIGAEIARVNGMFAEPIRVLPPDRAEARAGRSGTDADDEAAPPDSSARSIVN